MHQERVFVRIDYDEGEPASYRAVVVARKGGEEVQRWSSGNPQDDWKAYLEWSGAQDNVLVLETSSITHFLWDVPGWRMELDQAGREVIVPDPAQLAPEPGS